MKKSKVKTSEKIIEVYQLRTGKWCDYADCKTIYNESELEFIN